MRLHISTPRIGEVNTGNRRTAAQYARVFADLGYELVEAAAGADAMIALHAAKSLDAMAEFQLTTPSGKLILILTGTDINPAPTAEALEGMERADALVGLQPRSLQRVPEALRKKTRVIFQSAVPHGAAVEKDSDPFRICVVGHLRTVKDPMRAALAARDLPEKSKIRIEHAGAILEPEFEALVASEQRENPRYHYHGELAPAELGQLVARCQAMVISSHSEGGPRVLGESIVEGTPLIATRIEAITAWLGEDYPALFPVGDTAALTALMQKLETEDAFRQHLQTEIRPLAEQFSPESERAAWKQLLEEVLQR